jgi:hypothetical protein
VTPDLAAIALATIITLGYALGCAIWPFGHCRRCKGIGKQRSPFSRHYRICRRCKGSGLRLRIGRRAWNWWVRVHDKGSRRSPAN